MFKTIQFVAIGLVVVGSFQVQFGDAGVLTNKDDPLARADKSLMERALKHLSLTEYYSNPDLKASYLFLKQNKGQFPAEQAKTVVDLLVEMNNVFDTPEKNRCTSEFSKAMRSVEEHFEGVRLILEGNRDLKAAGPWIQDAITEAIKENSDACRKGFKNLKEVNEILNRPKARFAEE